MKTLTKTLLKSGAALALACGVLGIGADTAAAEACGGTYTIAPGDTLSQVSETLYDDMDKWSVIYQTNSSLIGESPNRIKVGMRLAIPCINGLPTGLEGGVNEVELVKAEPLVVPAGDPTMKRRINILTGDDRLPWSDRELPQGGMMTELVDAAMSAASPDGGYAIHWVNDWSSHFEPLMSNALVDAGFPWFKPDCNDQPDEYKCQNMVFSDPVFEVLVLLFVRAGEVDDFTTDAAMDGKTLCRPKGFSTFLLNQHGRNWEKDGKVEVVKPLESDECFEMLAEGEIDGIVINEFHGRKTLARLGLKDQIDVANGQPISVQGLHVAVHNQHPQAEEIIAMVSDGIAKIQEDGSHGEIVSRHLNRIWSNY